MDEDGRYDTYGDDYVPEKHMYEVLVQTIVRVECTDPEELTNEQIYNAI